MEIVHFVLLPWGFLKTRHILPQLQRVCFCEVLIKSVFGKYVQTMKECASYVNKRGGTFESKSNNVLSKRNILILDNFALSI